MSGGLPKGWVMTTLGEVSSKPQYGWTSSAAKTGSVKYVRTSDISQGTIEWKSVPYCQETPSDIEKYRVYQDDILVSRAGSVGVSHRVEDAPRDAVFASYLIRFNTYDGVHPRYIEFFLKSDSYWKAISEFTAGIAVPNVNASKLSSLDVPLAPANEQTRIVAKLEELLEKVDDCRERLEKIPTILKRFRQSVLAAACSGRLTADWRNQHPDIENATSLIKKQAFFMSEAAENLPDLPNTWAWVALGNYARCFRGRFTPRPRNDPRYFNGRHPFIQIGNLPREGGYVTSHVQTLNDEGLAVSRKFPKNTTVIAIVGATIGNSGILAYDMCVTDSIVGMEQECQKVIAT